MATRLLVAALQAAAAATAAAPADDARNTSCSVPPPSSAAVPPLSQLLNASLACSLGTAASPTDALSVQLSQQAVPETAYLDMRTTVFDRPASRLAAGKRVRVGLVTSIYGWNRLDNDTGATVAALEALATSDGPPLDLVTLEEEHNCNHGFTKERCCPHDNCALAAPFLSALKAVAKKHSFWLVVPMRTLDASSGRMSNSAVVVNRSGELAHSVAGQLSYDKTYPVLGKPAAGPGETGGESAVVPGSTGVQVWDTDFGRIAVLICFDINYFELWQEAYALGAEIVLWPTAMATPDRDMISLARAFRYSVVGCGHPGDIVDSTGRSVNQTVVRHTSATDPTNSGTITRSGMLDLDEVWIHQDNNCDQLKKLIADNKGKVEMARGCCGIAPAQPVPQGEDPSANAIGLLRSTSPDVSAKSLCVQYGIETARDYMLRSRQGLNGLRQYGHAIP